MVTGQRRHGQARKQNLALVGLAYSKIIYDLPAISQTGTCRRSCVRPPLIARYASRSHEVASRCSCRRRSGGTWSPISCKTVVGRSECGREGGGTPQSLADASIVVLFRFASIWGQKCSSPYPLWYARPNGMVVDKRIQDTIDDVIDNVKFSIAHMT